jgi:hypothetical protein
MLSAGDDMSFQRPEPFIVSLYWVNGSREKISTRMKMPRLERYTQGWELAFGKERMGVRRGLISGM